MKVTELRTYILENPGPRKFVFVKVVTDEGLYGWGEATLEMKQNTVVAAVRDLEQFVLGEDPTRIDYIWQRMYRHGFWRGGVAILSAISGIEQALWDITGKAYGQPVYKLLGGALRDFVPCYTHCGQPEQALRYMEEGWRAFKGGPRGWTRDGLIPNELQIQRQTASTFEAMRNACGEDVALMCDAHGRPRPGLAIKIGRALEPFNLLFLEEAVPPDNVANLRLVRDAGLSVDLATGERAFTKWGFREMIEGQLVDIIQPDICHDGGIKETLKIGALAETYNIQVAPHNPNGPVGTAASVHVAAVMPNFLILEYVQSSVRDVCQAAGADDCFKARNGRIELPAKPGLGIELDEEYLRAHQTTEVTPYGAAFNPDGSVADI